MLQLCFVLLSSVACLTLAGYSGSAYGNDLGGSDNSGYGYSGSYSGAGNPPENFAFPHFDFNNFLGNFQRFQQDLQQTGGGTAYSYASSGRNAKAHATSSITFNRNRILNHAQQAGAGGGIGAGGAGGGYGGGYSGQSFGGAFSGGIPGGGAFQFVPGSSVSGTFTPGDNGASAFGSIGPDGIQQKANVYPENPNSPNVNVRFGGTGGNPDGFRSVFTSSSSYTTNVDGQPKTVKQATTTVNDNGKVTTYAAKSP